jgi:phosphoribosyl 1,2-cyclic phosphodiesterase
MLLFKSLRSGSSGNVLLIESRRTRKTTRLLIDCGIRSQKGCLQILEEEAGLSEPIDGVLVTHAHSDHINYSALRVTAALGIPVYVHRTTRKELVHRYLNPYRLPASVDPSSFDLRSFGDETFRIGNLSITSLPIPHAPSVTTHAFVIHNDRTKIMIASDFHDPEAVVPHIYNCDFIYLESNHDLELLRQYFNPASLYHMSNPTAGLLLRHALSHSTHLPRAVVLGHLSAERNSPRLAIKTVREALRAEGLPDSLQILAAPRHAATETVVVAE